MSLLDVQIQECAYGRVRVLHDLHVTVGQGEIVAVLGNNGVGKTTLLRAISGVQVTTKGTVTFDGEDISQRRGHRRARAGIVHVPEGRHVFGELSVLENLRVGALYRSDGHRGSLDDDLEVVWDLFPILSERQDQSASTLSGGQQQMLAIGRGLMAGPKLLMVDEASLGLAPKVVGLVFDALTRIRDSGVAILAVEQNIRTSLAHADRGYVLERGTVSHEGSSAELRADETIVDAYLGAAVPPNGHAENRSDDATGPVR